MVDRRKFLSLAPAVGVAALSQAQLDHETTDTFDILDSLNQRGFHISVLRGETPGDTYSVILFDDTRWMKETLENANGGNNNTHSHTQYRHRGVGQTIPIAVQQAVIALNSSS